MKKYFLVLAATLLLKQAATGQRTDYALVWPAKKRIAINSIFVIEGILDEGNFAEVGKKYPIYLKAEKSNESTTLKIVEKNNRAGDLVQLICKPEKPLKAHTGYKLFIDGIEHFALLTFDPKSERTRECSWRTNGKTDTTQPILSGTIEYCEPLFWHVNGQPIQILRFTGLKSNSHAMLKIALKYPENSHSVEDLLFLTDTVELSSGSYGVFPEGQYEIAFQLVDASGNESKPVEFRFDYSRQQHQKKDYKVIFH